MPAEELRAKACRILAEAYSAGDLQALGELYSEGVLQHRSPLADLEGLVALSDYVADLRRSFSDSFLRVDQIIVEGDTHAARWSFSGRHSGRSMAMPVPPTGREAMVVGCSVAHWTEGRIDEEWVYVDWLGLFRQLGVIPPME